MDIYPRRIERFRSVIQCRQYDLTIVLENVHDPHNIGAILRTCDSVGINEIYIIYTESRLQKRGVEIGQNSASGAKQWIQIHYHEDVASCLNKVKSRYGKIYGTKLDDDAVSLYHLKLADSCALVFGNEHLGLSEDISHYLDGNFIIPQHGFVKSLNISVACAVSLYEAQRQRLKNGKYDRPFGVESKDAPLLKQYIKIHHDKKLPNKF